MASHKFDHTRDKYCEFMKHKYPDKPYNTKFCPDDGKTAAKVHRHKGSSYPTPFGIKDFLANIVKPVTGHIYNGVSRFYPEYKNKPEVSGQIS